MDYLSWIISSRILLLKEIVFREDILVEVRRQNYSLNIRWNGFDYNNNNLINTFLQSLWAL